MMLTVEAQIDENGNVKVLQPLSFSSPRRALVVVLDEPAAPPAGLDDDDILSKEDLEAEDRLWEETFKRHADKFAALRAQAEAEVAAGETIDAFDETGDFVLK